MEKKIKSIKDIPRFVSEAWQELKKVTWPGRRETLGATAVVVVLIIFTAVYLGLVDFAVQWVISLIYKVIR